ncbi:MAG: C45 family autoproteolytic acyltransferase/hydrolase [Promethearchaeota archaeon]
MRTFRHSGSYYDMGYKLGQQLKNLFNVPPCPPEKLKLSNKCRNFVKQYTPDLLEEIKGFCDAGNYDQEKMEAFLFVLGYELFVPLGVGCTVFTIGSELTESGLPIFARNNDFNELFQPYCEASYRAPLGKLKSIAFSDHMIGSLGGINEAGLAFAVLLAGNFDKKWQPGVRINLSTRWILENCHNTEEAVKFLEKIPHVRGQVLMIMDKDDNMARVETLPPHVAVTYAEKDYLFTTNHYQAESLKKYYDQNIKLPNSLERFNKTKTFLETRNKKFSLNDVKGFLSSHDNGVCHHYKWDGINEITIYSWVANVREERDSLQAWATTGSPCKNEYELYNFNFQ